MFISMYFTLRLLTASSLDGRKSNVLTLFRPSSKLARIQLPFLLYTLTLKTVWATQTNNKKLGGEIKIKRSSANAAKDNS